MIPSHARTAQAGGIAIPSVEESSSMIGARRFVARCVRGLTWRRLGAVIVFCTIYGSLLSLSPKTGGAPQSMAAYLIGLVAALTYFLPVLLAVTMVANFAPKRLVPRAVVLGATVAISLGLGYWLLTGVQGVTIGLYVQPPPHVRSPLTLLAIGWLGLAVMLLQERDEAAASALHESAEYRLDLGRQMSEAQLQVLQSQIEPHFLFNSLAHIRRLYQTDPRAGRAMMGHLSGYLTAAIPMMREQSIRLGQDLELAVAYLNVQQTRMGTRLIFEIDVPSEAMEARVPPMMLTTLVENALKHGLSPLPEGGIVRVVARLNGNTLTLLVSDTGQGFQANSGSGVGLANIRARLAMLYGTVAKLSFHQNAPRGITAVIVVPARLAHAPKDD